MAARKGDRKIAERFRGLVEDETYLRNLKDRLNAGALAPNLEIRLLEYVYGKPPDEINLNVTEDLSTKSTDELIDLAAQLQVELEQLRTVH